MGGGQATPKPESMASVLGAYSKYLPGLIQSTAGQDTNTAQQQLAATQATQPGYNALNMQQAAQYSVPLAQIGQQVQNSNAMAGQQTLNQELGAGGVQAGQLADQVARASNPNYYKVQDAASNQAANLLGSINMKGLAPGEQNAVERSLNQSNTATNNLGLDNATNAVSNAMNFGGAYNQKLGILGSALGAANQTAGSAQNTGFNPVNLAIGQPNASTMSNFGTGTFSNTNANTQNQSSNNAFGFGSSLMGNMSSMNNANTAATASQNNANSIPQYLSACCFIFLEAYHGKLPSFIRKSRDRYYRLQPDMATGYRRMACWLVPLMQHSSIARWLVWHLMVGRITRYLGYVNGVTKKYHGGRRTTHFWLRVWCILGKGHNESEYNKEWMPAMLVKG